MIHDIDVEVPSMSVDCLDIPVGRGVRLLTAKVEKGVDGVWSIRRREAVRSHWGWPVPQVKAVSSEETSKLVGQAKSSGYSRVARGLEIRGGQVGQEMHFARLDVAVPAFDRLDDASVWERDQLLHWLAWRAAHRAR